MRNRPGSFTRRDFLRSASAGIAAAALGSNSRESRAGLAKKAKVVVVRDEHVFDENHELQAKIIQSMLDDGVKALLGTQNPSDAWKHLVGNAESVGIKTNAWTYLATPPEVEEGVRRRLVEAGVADDQIRIDDWGARTTLASCSALINMRPLRTHHWAGIGGCLKNYIMFVETPSAYHDDACADLGKLWMLPAVKNKTRLNILVVLTPLFHGRGAHHFSPKHLWDYNGLIISQDPVAADAAGVRLLTAKRLEYFQEEVPFDTRAHHVFYADTRHGVGVADPERIDLVKIGWQEGVLI